MPHLRSTKNGLGNIDSGPKWTKKKCSFLHKSDLKTPSKCHISGSKLSLSLVYQKRVSNIDTGPKWTKKSVHSGTKMTSKHLPNAIFWDPNGHFFGCTKNGLGNIDSGPKWTKKKCSFLNKNDLKTPSKCHILGSKWSLFWVYQKRVRQYRYWTKMDQKKVFILAQK